MWHLQSKDQIGSNPLLDLEGLLQMLRAFGISPSPLSNEQVRNVFRQQKISSTHSSANALTKREFQECLLRLSILAAQDSSELRNAAPQKKLYELLKVIFAEHADPPAN